MSRGGLERIGIDLECDKSVLGGNAQPGRLAGGKLSLWEGRTRRVLVGFKRIQMGIGSRLEGGISGLLLLCLGLERAVGRLAHHGQVVGPEAEALGPLLPPRLTGLLPVRPPA